MIGILGGTFNPLHVGHIMLAHSAAEQCGMEKVLLIPTNVPPHKAAPDLADAQHRFNFCRIAAEHDTLLEACDIEIKRQGKSYTADTLEELSQIYPGKTLALIMGGDMFLTLDRWVRWREIIRLACICPAERCGFDGNYAGYRKMLEHEGAKILPVRASLPELSSTELRARLHSGIGADGLIPDGVIEYIQEKGLYAGHERL